MTYLKSLYQSHLMLMWVSEAYFWFLLINGFVIVSISSWFFISLNKTHTDLWPHSHGRSWHLPAWCSALPHKGSTTSSPDLVGRRPEDMAGTAWTRHWRSSPSDTGLFVRSCLKTCISCWTWSFQFTHLHTRRYCERRQARGRRYQDTGRRPVALPSPEKCPAGTAHSAPAHRGNKTPMSIWLRKPPQWKKMFLLKTDTGS